LTSASPSTHEDIIPETGSIPYTKADRFDGIFLIHDTIVVEQFHNKKHEKILATADRNCPMLSKALTILVTQWNSLRNSAADSFFNLGISNLGSNAV